MAFGTIFTTEANPRTTAILAVAKANGLELNIVKSSSTEPAPNHEKAHPLKKVPAFIGEDGYALSEAIAIAIYVTSQNDKTTLLGKTKQDYATIVRWMSFFNTDVLVSLANWFYPLLGRSPYNKKAVDDASRVALTTVAAVEEHLLHNTYLAGDRLTLADIFAAGIITRGFDYFFDKQWREKNPNTTRWFTTVINQPIYADAIPPVTFLDTPALTNVAPKKPEAPKKEAKKEAPKQVADEEEEDKPAPKSKHPLEALPKPTFALDEFKRVYSNANKTADALEWFWSNIKWDEFSIWQVKYKYNDELTLPFKSRNLLSGFDARLEASRKYLFGCGSVYGDSENSVIEGAFVIRGNEHLPVFDVAPDYESYEFIKLDHTKPEDKEYVNAQWTWEAPVVVDGKEYPHAGGKVFK